MVKSYNGKIYIFAANLKDAAYDCTFTFNANVSAGSVNVYDEGRSIAFSGQQFTDNFAPFSVHIYTIDETSPPAPGDRIIDHNDDNAGILSDGVLDQIRNLDVYFEHASVGGNIMGGLQILSNSDSRFSYTGHSFSSVPTSDWYVNNNGFGDYNRGNPGLAQKISLFDADMRSNDFADSIAVAMFKFC